MDKEAIAERLSYFLKQRNITANRLSTMCEVSQTAISQILRAKKCPTVETLSILCSALGITLAEFFTDHEADASPAGVFTSNDPADYLIGEGTDNGSTWSIDLPPEAQKELLEYAKYLAFKYKSQNGQK